MRCGGRCGDLCGDPLGWVIPDKAIVQTDRIKVLFTTLGDIMPGCTFTLKGEAAVIETNAVSGGAYTLPAPKAYFALAAVAPGVQDGAYDPLLGDDISTFPQIIQGAAVDARAMVQTYAPLEGDIVAVALTKPLNPLAANGGAGDLQLQWDAPAQGVVDHYDVFLATALAGTYVKAGSTDATVTRLTIRSLEFGLTVYVKIQAVDAAGNAGPMSDPAEDATLVRGTTQLEFTGPSGDEIADNAIFTCQIGD